jgi:hypothetical protein
MKERYSKKYPMYLNIQPIKYSFEEISMSDTEIREQEPAPDFTLPAVGSDDIVKDGQVHLGDLRGKMVVARWQIYPEQRACRNASYSSRRANNLLIVQQ